MDPMTTDATTRSGELSSVANSLRLLEELAAVPEAGVSALARQLEVSKSTVDRLLRTLAGRGFVEQNPDNRRYRLTFKIAVLAEGVRSRTGIVEIARPFLKELDDRLQEGANLGVLVEGSLVYADSINSPQMFRIAARPGTTLPAYCTGGGKALLAFLPPAELDRYLEGLVLERHTANTLTTVPALKAALEEIRGKGFSLDRGELLEEAFCAAAPVLDAKGAGIAAISVTATQSRFEPKRERIIEAVRTAAAQMSELLATQPPSLL